MAESYSVEAILSAKDNMSGVFGKAAGAAGSFGSKLKGALGSGLAMGAGMKAVESAISAISGSMDGAISRYDTIKNFPKIMSNLGYSASDAEKAIAKIGDKLTGLPTSTDAIVSSAQKLAPLTGSIGKATDVALAMNNALLAGGKSMETQSNALEQYSQMMAAGKVDMQAWRSMLDAMPGQLDQLAVSLLGAGKGQNDLYEAMQNGQVSFDDFNAALLELNENGVNGLASFAEQAKTSTQGIATNIQNVKTAITRGLANSITAIDEALAKNNMPSIADMISKAGEKIGTAFNGINNWIGTLDWQAIGNAGKNIAHSMAEIGKAAIPAIRNLASAFADMLAKMGNSGAFDKIASAAKQFFGFISAHADTIAQMVPKIILFAAGLSKAKLAFEGFMAVKGLVTSLGQMASNFTRVGATAAASVAPTMAAATAETTAGNAARVSAKSFMQVGVAIMAIGAGIMLAATGFYILAQAAISLANAGGLAIGVMAGMVLAIGGLIALTSVMGPGLTAAAPGILAFGAAFLMIGIGVGVASLGLSKLAKVLPPVIAAVGSAVRTIGSTIMGILLTMGGVINSVLLTAAMAFRSFGNTVVTVLTAFGNTVNSILTTVGQLFQQFATSVQTILQGVADIVTAVGEAISNVLNSIANIFTAIGVAALQAGMGFQLVANGISQLVALPLGDLAGTMKTVAGGIKKIANAGDGLTVVGPALTTLGSGLARIGASGQSAVMVILKLIITLTTLKTAANGAGRSVGTGFSSGLSAGLTRGVSRATSATNRIIAALRRVSTSARAAGTQAGSGFNSSLSSGLSRGVSVATSATTRIVAALRQLAVTARSAGTQAGQGFCTGLHSGLSRASSVASSAVSRAVSRLRSGIGSARSAGRQMGAGFASGMSSAASRCEAAASRIVAAAARAARAAAQIHSPSKLFATIGKMMTAGLAKGMVGSKGMAENGAATVIKRMGAASSSKAVQAFAKNRGKVSAAAQMWVRALVDGMNALSNTAKNWLGKGLTTWMAGAVKSVKGKAVALMAGVSATMRGAVKKHNFTATAEKAVESFKKGLTSYTTSLKKSSKNIVNGAFSTIKAQVYKNSSKGNVLADALSRQASQMKIKVPKSAYDEIAKGKSLSSALGKITDKTQRKRLEAAMSRLAKRGTNLTQNLTKAQNLLNSKLSGVLTSEMNKVISVANTKLTALGKKYQEKYDAIAQARSNFISKMQSYGSLYEKVEGEAAKYDSYGFLISSGTQDQFKFKDFAAATKELKTLQTNLRKLQNAGISQSFLNEITSMDTASQLEYTTQLLKKGTGFIKEQNSQYLTFMKTASSVGNKIYQPYVSALDSAYKKDLAKVMKDLRKQVSAVGMNAAKGLVKGLNDKKTKGQLNAVAAGLGTLIVKQLKKKLKIKSPSRVMRTLGNFTGEGLANGINEMRQDVTRAVNNLVAIPDMAVAGGYNGSLSSEYEYAAQAHYTIEVHTDLDGKEVARTIAEPMQAELDRRETRANRQRGIL